MSHYKPYPAYKDSGVEWIGLVPIHWTTAQLRRVIQSIEQGWSPECDVWPAAEGEWGVLKAGCVNNGEYREWENKALPPHFDAKPEYEVVPGDILMSRASGSPELVGSAALVNTTRPKLMLSDKVFRVRLRSNATPRFFVAAIGSRPLRFQIENELSGGNGLANNLPQSALMAFVMPLPSVAEQASITASLDGETARIDALIAKKSRFIELLTEKRQALITHAVTRGLDPVVTMKDSGVDWIVEVPEHWEVLPSTWLFVESSERAREDDEHLSATQKYGVIPLAEYERLESRQVTHAVKNLEQRKHVEIDNFVISMRSFEGGIERVKARGCVRSSYVVLLPEAKADVGFYAYLLKSSTYIQGLQATASFVRDGQDLSYGNFRQVKLPVPGLEEQRAIAQYLDRSIARIDSLTGMTERSITLLKERRAALISAAVTGQIDLRSTAANEP